MKPRRLNASIGIACSMVLFLTHGVSLAQSAHGLSRVGDEIVVAETNRRIRNTGLAASSRGFVSVWSERVPGGESREVFGAIFGPDGERVTDRFMVNSNQAGFHPLSAVAMSGGGDVFVAWRTEDEVVGQRLDSVGEAVGGEIRVSSDVGNGNGVTLTGFGDGSFVVVWPDYSDRVLKASMVQPDNTDGADFVVSTDPSVFGQYIPSVQSNTRGEFVVAWSETGTSHPTRGGIEVLVGWEMEPIKVSSIQSHGHRGGLDACINEDGEMVVVWGGSQRNSDDRIWFRRYLENEPVEDSTMLTPDDSRIVQDLPSVVCMPESFTAVWAEGLAIRGRRLADTGRSDDFRILVPDGVFKVIARTLDSEAFVVSWGECSEEETCQVRAQIFTTREIEGMCRGDCSRDGVTTVDELVTMTNAALFGSAELVRTCLPGDTNLDYEIRVNELIGAVSDLLGNQCAG